MAFHIGDDLIMEQKPDFDSCMQLAMLLPAPEIRDYSTNKVKPKNVALCVQREILYSKIQPGLPGYLGTIGATICVSAFLFSDSHAAIIHIDNTRRFQLPLLLKFFDKSELIRVILVGGRNDPISRSNVKAILEELFLAQLREDFNITIKSAYLCEKNKPLPSSEDQFYFNKLLKKLNWLYHELYNKALPFNEFQQHGPNDFQRDFSVVEPIFFELFISLLISAAVIKNIETEGQRQHGIEQLQLSGNEKIFMDYAHAMFSAMGRSFLSYSYKAQFGEGLENYAFDVKTGDVIEIPDYWPMPYSAERQILPFDSFRVLEYKVVEAGKEVKPILSENFTTIASRFIDIFTSKKPLNINEVYLHITMKLLKIPQINFLLAEYLRTYLLQSWAPTLDLSCLSTSLQEYLAEEHPQLTAIRRATECRVTGKWQASTHSLAAEIHLEPFQQESAVIDILNKGGSRRYLIKINAVDGRKNIVIPNINDESNMFFPQKL